MDQLNKLKINESPGVDNIHPKAIAEITFEIVNFLTQFFKSITRSQQDACQ